MRQEEASAGALGETLSVYEQLHMASPEERVDIIFGLMEKHPAGKLELPAKGELRANLNEIDLSRGTIAVRYAERLARGSPPWWNADLQSVDLSGANLQGALLNNANLRGVILARANLDGILTERINLRQAHLAFAKMREAFVANADLGEASLNPVDLSDTWLIDCDLEGAYLRSATLRNTRVVRCNLRGAYLSGAILSATHFQPAQLDDPIGEELDGQYGAAKLSYRALKQNFESLGDRDAASFAYRKERRMGKKDSWHRAKSSFSHGPWMAAPRHLWHCTMDLLQEWTCDYGESPLRVLLTLAALWLLFALIYGLSWGVTCVYDLPIATVKVPASHAAEWMLYSLRAMTTLGPEGLEPRTELAQWLSGLQALLGVMLAGLLGFVLGNRIRRS